MRLIQFVSRGISGRSALLILVVVILVHLTTMLVYLQSNRAARDAARRDAVIQKIINAIYLVEATPLQNRKHAVAAMADPNLHVSLSAKPIWPLKFTHISFWQISRALRDRLDSFELSIQLDSGQWLNLNATIYSHTLLTQLLFLFLEVMVFGAILMATWSINRFTRPLKQFKLAAERLGLDLHAKPLDVYGPTVVREAAEAMNKMQGRIQDLIQDRTQMLAAISHDLRTPITRMKLRAQFIEDALTSQDFIADLDEMEHMINETLAFSREDFNTESKALIDLVSLVQSICDDAGDLGYCVTFHAQVHRAGILGRKLALKRALTNLIGNACRYAKKIDVVVHRTSRAVVVWVEDDGPGIPEQDLQNVFRPFYRGEGSRSRNTGGVGLGLATTYDIVRSHYGKISLENRKPCGLRAKVELPAL